MSASLMPMPKQAFYGTVNGVHGPIVGGKVYTYEAGTTTPKATYTTAAGNVANPNPVVLDARGEASVWLGFGAYDIVLKGADDAQIWTQDGVRRGSDSSTIDFRQAGTGAVGRTAQDKLREIVSVKDFGAVGDGVTNDAPAVSAAIAAAFASGGNTVFFPDGIYYFAAPVTVVFDTFRSLRLVGTSSAGFTSVRPGGSRITGASGIDALFIFTKTTLTAWGGYSFHADGIDFNGNSRGVGSAILNKVGGGPARPFNVNGCNFQDFQKAIQSDISASGLTTGICQVNITGCNFQGNNYALYSKGPSAIMDLRFVGNVCEQNKVGGIYTETGALGGGVNISDNLLEGQPDAIVINAGKMDIDVSRNYFEANTGALISVNCTNSSSSATVADNYILNSSGAYVFFNNLLLNSNQDFKDASVQLRLGTSGKSRIGNRGIVNLAATAPASFCLDVNSVPMRSAVPSNVTTGAYTTAATTKRDTPAGSLGVEAVNGNGTLHTMTGTVASGDKIVVMAMARVKEGTSATAYINCLDSANAALGNTETSAPIGPCGQDEWLFVCRILKVSGPSTGTFKFRWVTSANIEFTDSYVYTVASPTDSTDYPVFMPSSGLVSADQLLGRFFPQTSASGTTSIVDTGIFRTTKGVGYGSTAIYDVFVTGVQNAGANSYKTIMAGIIAVGVGSSGSEIFYSDLFKPNFTGVAEFTVSAVFWDGTTESATASASSTTHQIRLKVDGYNASYVGYDQVVRMVRRL